MICITPKRESRTDGLSRDQRYTRAGNADVDAAEQAEGRGHKKECDSARSLHQAELGNRDPLKDKGEERNGAGDSGDRSCFAALRSSSLSAVV